MFLDQRSKTPTKKIAARVAAHLKQKNLRPELVLTAIAEKGAAGPNKMRS
jgi:hypothetical protein